MTLAEILAPYGITDEEYVAELAGALSSRPVPSAAALTSSEREVLGHHGGVKLPLEEPGDAARLWLANVTSNLAEQIQGSLTVDETATMLGISGSRVRHRVHEGALYAFKAAHHLRLPRWQFHGDEPLPGLRKVLAALIPDLHPLEVSQFMTTAEADLEISEKAVSPREWLVVGGDPAAVAHLASLIGAGW
jgi:hypothetical protein